jgi:hypothetical protein
VLEKVLVEGEESTHSKQLKTLDNVRVMPRLISVASRFALLRRNVTIRTGIKNWPPTTWKENQTSNKVRTWGETMPLASTHCQHISYLRIGYVLGESADELPIPVVD